mgnify:CR=1 FL=1
MFASSTIFSDLYVQELAYWTEGMPWDSYLRNIAALGIDVTFLTDQGTPVVERRERTDIWDIGSAIEILDPGVFLSGTWDCDRCLRCVKACPERALSFQEGCFTVDAGRCLGMACRRCEDACPADKFSYDLLN